VWETSDQLQGNLDSEYKRKLLRTMAENFKGQDVVRAGELELVGKDGTARDMRDGFDERVEGKVKHCLVELESTPTCPSCSEVRR
jgi:Icc-related predicted phosphoesterase